MASGGTPVLYYTPHSFFSQKASMAFMEKQEDFKAHLIDLFHLENYEPWYMEMNPKGQVPVLKDGEHIIPGSLKIAEHLDNKYGPPLLVPDKETDYGQKVMKLIDLMEEIPIEVVSYGTLMYYDTIDFVEDCQMPTFFRRKCAAKSTDDKFRVTLKKYEAASSGKLKDLYTEKLANSKHMDAMAEASREDVLKAIALVETVLTKMEEALTNRETPTDWLCGSEFTFADISLCCLLARLRMVGLSKHLVDTPKRPLVLAYYERMSQRPSVKQSCFFGIGPIDVVKLLGRKVGPMLAAGLCVGAVAIGLGYWFISHQK